MMEDIYNEIDEYVNQTQVDDYIKYHIKPQYSKIKYNVPPQLEPSNLLTTNDNEIIYYIDDMNKILNKINILQTELKGVINNDNNCPICFEILNEQSYVVTKCKHKTCLTCYLSCLNQNKDYSNKCSICRNDII